MTDYIKREDAIEQARRNWIGEGEWIASTETQLLKNLPSADVVSREAYDQIKWERDTAIAQLEELGYGLGEEIRHD